VCTALHSTAQHCTALHSTLGGRAPLWRGGRVRGSVPLPMYSDLSPSRISRAAAGGTRTHASQARAQCQGQRGRRGAGALACAAGMDAVTKVARA
jgi:hypothetical protein